jgi:hypothetical protein
VFRIDLSLSKLWLFSSLTMSQITLELADGRTLIVDHTSEHSLHRQNAMTVYNGIYSWLICARKFEANPSSDEILFYLVKCVSDGWIEVSPEIVESQLYGVGIPK